MRYQISYFIVALPSKLTNVLFIFSSAVEDSVLFYLDSKYPFFKGCFDSHTHHLDLLFFSTFLKDYPYFLQFYYGANCLRVRIRPWIKGKPQILGRLKDLA